jgi:hypothetical protein
MNAPATHDRARSRMLQALARRIDAQPEAVRRILQARLEARLAECGAHQSDPAAPAPRRATRKTAASPLAELNRALREARPDADIAPGGEELTSARRFRAAWDAQRALEKLERALSNKPAQPGPLNSHALLLQAMELMRTLSPHYLRHFLLHAETLLWLDDAKARPVRARRRK